jgi:signal transduction histidine kinase
MNSAPTLVIPGAWLVGAFSRLTGAIARLGWPVRYALALFSTALVTAVMALSGLALEPANISLIYLLVAQRQLLATLASQAALVVERARLVAEVAQAQALAASDRLKSTLLSSVSHDLRTPLAAVKGIATALRQHDVPWNSAVGEEMLDTLPMRPTA